MKIAVISGGTGGLGRSISDNLQKIGFKVYLLDLNIKNTEHTNTQIPMQCDITDETALKLTAEEILSSNPKIDLVIYNAGITQICPFEQISEESHRKVFEINYFAATNMASLFLLSVRAAKGTHLAISSVAGFSPLYHRTTYAASKHALEGFFKSLRSEEKRHNVSVLIAAPSFVATNLDKSERQSDGTGRPGAATDGTDYMSPENAADVILNGYHKATPMILVGRIAKLAWWINRFAPQLYQKLMERKISGD